jgi:hypothetical protein
MYSADKMPTCYCVAVDVWFMVPMFRDMICLLDILTIETYFRQGILNTMCKLLTLSLGMLWGEE